MGSPASHVASCVASHVESHVAANDGLVSSNVAGRFDSNHWVIHGDTMKLFVLYFRAFLSFVAKMAWILKNVKSLSAHNILLISTEKAGLGRHCDTTFQAWKCLWHHHRRHMRP